MVKAGVPFDLVVHEVSPGGGTNDNYSLKISGIELVSTVKINGKLDTVDPANTPDFETLTGTQDRRISRNGIRSTCDEPKIAPGPFSSGGRRFDSYEFVPARSGCVEVTLESVHRARIFSAAYDQNGFNPSDPTLNNIADPEPVWALREKLSTIPSTLRLEFLSLWSFTKRNRTTRRWAIQTACSRCRNGLRAKSHTFRF